MENCLALLFPFKVKSAGRLENILNVGFKFQVGLCIWIPEVTRMLLTHTHPRLHSSSLEGVGMSVIENHKPF